MRTIDVLMPAADCDYASEAADVLGDYHAAFAARGLTLAPRPWTEGAGAGDAALALFAWGYHEAPAAWIEILDGWPADRQLFNPPALLRWNLRKTYLAELEAGGVRIVPSWFGDADAASVAAAFERFGTDRLVIKPQVSAGSYRTAMVTRGDPVAPLAEAIIQPFVASIADEGELSLLYIGGAFSHAVRKVPRAGDFRIQPQFGGRFSPAVGEAEAQAIGKRVLARLPERPLYARVDLVRLADGELALMELEVIEPDLYLDHAGDVPGRLADALLARLAQ